jgi:hypothetical protein
VKCESLSWAAFEIGSQISRLAARAFGTSRLTSIHLPALVTVICKSCFSYCGSLTSITFQTGSQLSQLADWAFSKSGLTSIHLLTSVTDFRDLSNDVSFRAIYRPDYDCSTADIPDSFSPDFSYAYILPIHSDLDLLIAERLLSSLCLRFSLS